MFGRKNKYDELVGQIKEMQIVNANLMLRMADYNPDSDNDYETHAAQTAEIITKYKGCGSTGNELMKRIINVSAALQIPDGIELAVEGKGEEIKNHPELFYLQKCSKANALDAAMTTFYSRELQKQGQLLFELIWDDTDEKNVVMMKYYPWDVYNYRIQSMGLNNLLPPFMATWDEDQVPKSMGGDSIVFISINTTIDSEGYIEGWPTVGGLLNRIDAVGKDLQGWRQSNKLYAYPTPHVKTGDRENAKQVAGRITESGWTVGQMLVTGGEFTMVVPQNYYETLSESIKFNLQLISGGTGIAISWLGFPDLMSNRSTSQSLGEPIEIASPSDITTWKTFFLQLFNGMIRLRNQNLGTSGANSLREDQVVAKIRPISDRQWKILTEVFMPAAKGNLLTPEAFLERIPDFDYKAELVRREKKEKEEGAKAVEPTQPLKGSSMRIKPGESTLMDTDNEQ